MIINMCLYVQCCVVQAIGKSMEMMVLQERATYLNLTNLSDKDILDIPIVPESIFSYALVSMWCEQWKNKDKSASRFKIPKQPNPHPIPSCPAQAASENQSSSQESKESSQMAQPSHRLKSWMFPLYQFCTSGQ